MAESIRVLLVEQLTLLRRSLVELLQRRRGLQVVADAAGIDEALARARELQPDVIVLEPQGLATGAKLIGELCQAAPASNVLVLTSSGDEGIVSQALQAGARGFVQKDCEPDDLVRAIQAVHAGQLVVAPTVADAVVRGLSGESTRDQERDRLTPREREVLRLVAQGWTNPEIARKLCITEYTVKGHLAKIMNKLGFVNRVQLATYAIQEGLVERPDLRSIDGGTGAPDTAADGPAPIG